jgi:sulfide dehydrogenase cytochrome subunit
MDMPSKLKILLAVCLVSPGVFSASMDTFAAKKKTAQSAKAAEVDPRGQVLALSCAGCHGTDGKSSGIIPSIYGKTPDYIEAALKDFKSGVRYSTVMGRHAKGYSDEEIHLIAQYFGTLWGKNK